MQPITCSYEKHAGSILALFNDAILTSTALYDYKPRTMEDMQAWFEVKQTHGFPVIGLEDENGRLMAFGSYGTFRTWAAYKYTVEHSLYVHRDCRGRGLGRSILRMLVDAAEEQQLHMLAGVIDASNAASIRLHEQEGFVHAGTLREAAFKFGRWLDVVFYQKILPTPEQPKDG